MEGYAEGISDGGSEVIAGVVEEEGEAMDKFWTSWLTLPDMSRRKTEVRLLLHTVLC